MAIDGLRLLLPGNVSRNTWIALAIQEKIYRDAAEGADKTKEERHA